MPLNPLTWKAGRRMTRPGSTPPLLGAGAVSAFLVLSGFLLLLGAVPIASAQEVPPLVTEAEYERWQVELSNWGRWGPDDELGALNLITPAKHLAAARLIREGITVSLASTAQTERTIDNPCPLEWEMANANRGGATDRISYRCIHGPGTTHIDGFAHRFFDGKMWNGYDVADLVTMEEGALKNDILTMKNGIVTRGVLYDIPRLKGVPYLEPGTRITVQDLEAWEAQAGVRVGPGDAFLLRWGRWARQDAIGPFDTGAEAAGLDNTVIPWLKARDVALIGWETPGYMPLVAGELPRLALHDFALTMLGIHLLDRADFDALSEVAAAQGRWEFMLTIAPMPIPNGTGSPVNPIAIF